MARVRLILSRPRPQRMGPQGRLNIRGPSTVTATVCSK
ncbi:hypothetical protein DFAR_1340025 [Desulfarculales bacterium]